MPLRAVKRVVVVSLAFMVSGCMTVGTLADSETKNKVYSGTIAHVENGCGHGLCLDLPFSLVLDTVLLPVTIPFTIYKFVTTPEVVDSADQPSSN